MWKKFLIHAIAGAVLASIASIIYNAVYCAALYSDFSKVINIGQMVGGCIFGSLLIGIGHLLVYKWKGEKLIGVYNIIITVLSFASIISVLAFRLPLDVESPELFAGLAIPMHFFPALAYFAVAPFFRKEK